VTKRTLATADRSEAAGPRPPRDRADFALGATAGYSSHPQRSYPAMRNVQLVLRNPDWHVGVHRDHESV